jgi:hypothetical protein
MVVYLGRGPDNKWGFFSVLQTQGAGWQQSALPMLPGRLAYPSEWTARQLIAGPPEGGYHFIGSYSGKVYYWHWQNGHWSSPELVTDEGSSGTGIALDSSGAPVIASSSTRFRYFRKVGGQWQKVQLSPALSQVSLPSIVTGANGGPHLLGMYRGVPVVATLPAGKDPTQESNWIITPTGNREGWSSALPTSGPVQVALDWPHQRVWAVWVLQKTSPYLFLLRIGWAPVGATSAAQWQSAAIDLPEHASFMDNRLVSDGYGHVGLAYVYLLNGDRSLHFRWLGSNGPGPDLELVRPGTQTEACAFSNMVGGSVNVGLDRGGQAHVVVRAVKRGEVPANQDRLFYATVTGGGLATSEEPGGATTTGEAVSESPKPDFVVSIPEPTPGENLRIGYDSLRPRAEITNQGAQYFGDLWLEANQDGAKVRIHIPDPSGHRLPLFTRGQKKTVYLPAMSFSRTPDPQYPPSAVSYEQSAAIYKHVTTATGLGRKLISVTVDPDNQVDEADEDNNSAQAEYRVYDGRNTADREKGPDGKYIYGLNDLALVQAQLKSNTPLWRAGYLQRPTQLQTVVTNPRLAGFFAKIEVALSLDGQEIGRRTVDLLDNKFNLWSGALTQTVVYGAATPKPDLSGAVLDFPVDLTQVTEGNHKLRVVVDPEDKFGDRHRENNTVEINFKVRGPGGTLRVQVVDKDDGITPINRALVSLRALWAQLTDATGGLEIPDVPPGNYDGKALAADRTGDDPRYYPSYASPFAVTANQTTTVTVPLEKAVVIVGDVYDTSTNALLTGDLVNVAVEDADFYHPTYVNGPHYQILDVPPGERTIRAGAYSFRETQVTQEVHRGPQGQARVDLRLQPGPRAVVEGTVLDEATNRPIADASVWLNGAPRSAMTDAQGRFRLDRVAANTDYQAMATAENYTLESTTTGRLTEGQTKTLPPLKLAKVSSRLTSLDFHAITWADFEGTSTGKGSFKVRVKYGQFDASLAMLYRTTTGRPGVDVDQVVVGVTPGPWCESRVSTYAAPGIVCMALQEAKAGANDLWNGNLLTLGQRIKSVYDYATGKFDPAQLGTEGTVVGSYTSQSENKYTPQVSVFGLPVSEGLWGFSATEGTTTVRVDKVEVTDGATTKTVSQQWFSPSLAAYQIGGHFDQDKLEVRIYLKVMNQNLSVGPLYANSENVITWKPMQNKWARMDPRPY